MGGQPHGFWLDMAAAAVVTWYSASNLISRHTHREKEKEEKERKERIKIAVNIAGRTIIKPWSVRREERRSAHEGRAKEHGKTEKMGP